MTTTRDRFRLNVWTFEEDVSSTAVYITSATLYSLKTRDVTMVFWNTDQEMARVARCPIIIEARVGRLYKWLNGTNTTTVKKTKSPVFHDKPARPPPRR